jgi:hypothetical protein
MVGHHLRLCRKALLRASLAIQGVEHHKAMPVSETLQCGE